MNRMKRKGVIVAAIAALASSVALGAVAATTDDSAALLKQARQPFPTSYKGPTVPASAPKQVKLALITCFSILRGCYSPTIGATHAAKALGWKVTTYDGGGNPRQQNQQMLNRNLVWGERDREHRDRPEPRAAGPDKPRRRQASSSSRARLA